MPQSLWVIDPLSPSKKRIGLLGGSSSINPAQRHGTKGLMWGAIGHFPPAVAMVVMFVLGCWFTSAHIYFWNNTYLLEGLLPISISTHVITLVGKRTSNKSVEQRFLGSVGVRDPIAYLTFCHNPRAKPCNMTSA